MNEQTALKTKRLISIEDFSPTKFRPPSARRDDEPTKEKGPEKKLKPKPLYIEKLEKIIGSSGWNVYITSLTVIALFANDLFAALSNKSGDDYCDGILVLCTLSFLFEFIASILTKKGYLWSFFFYLDFISTLSLIFDITFISGIIFGTTGQ
jgi:hypothetical protein